MNKVREQIPLLARHEGVWEGTYRHIDPQLKVLDQYDFRILVEFPEDGSCDYRQTSHYTWPDGRKDTLIFEAHCSNAKLVWETDLIAGALWAIDETTLYLYFSFPADPDVVVREMIQLSPCGQHRARTWHWFRKHELFQITLVDEKRAAAN